MSFYNAFNLPVTVARPFNTYGPRQSARAIIPAIIIQILSGANQIKLGDVTPTRDFTFVRDTCQGLLYLAECESAIGKEINISSNSEISISDLFGIIKEFTGSDVELVTDGIRVRPVNSEVFRLWGDNSLLKSLSDFDPIFNLKQGLEITLDWFRKEENIKKYKSRLYNI